MARPIFGLVILKSDTIILLKVNKSVQDLVREVISNLWSKGIQAEHEINCGCSIKLKGRPWAARDVGVDCHEGLHLLANLVEKLRPTGWLLHCAVDVGARLVNAEESHAYSTDGNMIIFVREDLEASAAARKNGQTY